MNTNMIGAQAVNLYKNTANLATQGISSGDQDQVSFGTLFKSGLEKIVETQKKSEAMSQAAVVGKASITDVVEAAEEATVVLDTAIALRDRVIGAYQEIMRMPI